LAEAKLEAEARTEHAVHQKRFESRVRSAGRPAKAAVAVAVNARLTDRKILLGLEPDSDIWLNCIRAATLDA
jgi:hypothetical protein